MPRSSNGTAAAMAARLAADGESQAEITDAIAAATGLSERQARRYAQQPLATADSLERLCHRLQDMFVRADAMSDFKAAAAISKQLMDAYHRLDLARQSETYGHAHMPF